MFQTETDSLLPADPVDAYFIFVSHTEGQTSVSTEGMRLRGLPEIVIEGVRPRFLASQAAALLTRVADYMLQTDAELKVGQTVVVDPDTIVRFVEPTRDGAPDDEDVVFWMLQEVPMVCCPECEGGDHEISPPSWRRGPPN